MSEFGPEALRAVIANIFAAFVNANCRRFAYAVIRRLPPHGSLPPRSCLRLVLLLQWSHSKILLISTSEMYTGLASHKFTLVPGVHIASELRWCVFHTLPGHSPQAGNFDVSRKSQV